MNDVHDAMLDDVAVYALGSLPAADAERVRRHLETCDECRAEYKALLPAATAVGVSAEACADAASGAVAASPLLKARIMRAVRTAPARRPTAWYAYLAAAACFAFALATLLYSLSLNERLHSTQAQLAQALHQTTFDDALVGDLTSAKAQRINVPGGEVVRANGHLYLAMHEMPAAPSGKVYQAWTLPKGSKTMVPSVTFVPDSRGVALVPVGSNANDDVAVAVSVEPPGGSKQPTSAPVLLAHLE